MKEADKHVANKWWYDKESFGGVALEAGRHVVCNDGEFLNVRVTSGATLVITDNGKASGCSVQSDGLMEVQALGQVCSTTVENGGFMNVLNDCTVEHTTIQTGGKMVVSGSANGIVADYNACCVVRGAVVSVGITGGRLIVSPFGRLDNASIYSGGTMLVQSSASARQFTIHSGGTAIVESAGKARDFTLKPGGTLLLTNGSIISGMDSLRDLAVDEDQDHIIIGG